MIGSIANYLGENGWANGQPVAVAATLANPDMSRFDIKLALNETVKSLRDKGVEFQTFDMPGIEWTAGVATMGPMRSVWFADPDGNILNVSEMA